MDCILQPAFSFFVREFSVAAGRQIHYNKKNRQKQERTRRNKGIFMEQKIEQILTQVKRAVKGKDTIVEKVMMAMLAKGHILLEDIPGVGKTTLAMAFSRAVDLECRRVQFTPDVLPSDVIGFSIMNENRGFEYKPGAVLCNLFLADEINRTSSKTQSALLEVMEEGRVTVDGITRELKKPFTVIATQNPVGSIGTQKLPESQLDRFMICLTMGYPSSEDEMEILRGRQQANPLEAVQKAADQNDLLLFQEKAGKIFVHDAIIKYITVLAEATRNHEFLELGLSPRGSLALMAMAKARAFIMGREYCLPEDVQAVFYDVAAHRMLLNSRGRLNHIKMQEIVAKLLAATKAPRVVK